MKDSCLTCALWPTCTYAKKAANYICDDFEEQPAVVSLDFLSNMDKTIFKSQKEEKAFYKSKEAEITDMLESYLDAKAPIPKDLKVDDTHIPLMKNFFEFCFDRDWGFRGIRPFARQLWMGLKLFGEICPVCTKSKYYKDIRSIPVNYKPERIKNKLTLLEHGVCPKCKSRKSKLVKKKKMELFTDLGAIFGQRCVVGGTYILTNNGLERIGAVVKNEGYGFTEYEQPIFNGKQLENSTHAFVSHPEHTYAIYTAYGHKLEGTADHPINSRKGFTTLGKITENDRVELIYNTQVFGSKPLPKSNLTEEKTAFLLGLWTANSFKDNLTLQDNVLEKGLALVSEFSWQSVASTKFKNLNRVVIPNGEDLSALIGFSFLRANDRKRIPDCILTAPKDIQIEFLKGFFENRLDTSRDTFGFRCSSALADGLVAMLLNMGILPTITYKNTLESKREDSRTVFISIDNAQTVKLKILIGLKDGELSEAPIILFPKVAYKELSREAKITYDLTLPESATFWTNGFRSSNSGKSISVSFLFCYLTQQFLKQQKPADLFLGVPNQYLTGTVVAPNLKDCMILLWRPILDAMADSPWFEEYHQLLKDSNKKYGVESFKVKDTYIDYGFRKMILMPQAANLRTLRGRSRFGFACDEFDYFDAGEDSGSKITISGRGVWDALNTSMATVQQAAYNLLMRGYDAIPTAVSFNISSPCRTPGVLSEMVSKPLTGFLALRLATWDINPNMKRDSPIIMKAYDLDAVQAETNFGANPPSSGSHYISPDFNISELFSGQKNRIEYQYDHAKDNLDGLERLYRFIKILSYNNSGYNYGSVLSLDCGATNNSFAITISHKDQSKIVHDLIIDIVPEHGKTVLHYPNIVKKVLHELIPLFNVKVAVADRWNSLYLLQEMQDLFPQLQVCRQYSVTYEDFVMYKSYIVNKAVVFPKLDLPEKQCIQPTSAYPQCYDYKPVAHLYHQLITVQDRGYTVDKGEGRTDDILRTLVLASAFLLHKKSEKWLFHKPIFTGERGIIASANSSSGALISTKTGKGIIAG